MIRPGFWRQCSAIALGVWLALWLCGGDREAEAIGHGRAAACCNSVATLSGDVARHRTRQSSVAREGRTYHRVTVAQLSKTQWTHVEVCGTVTLVKKEADGDLHVRISEADAFIVAETVPYHVLPAPRLQQRICVRGISRIDKTHGSWAEVHPVESWRAQ